MYKKEMLEKETLEYLLLDQNIGLKPLSRLINVNDNTLRRWCRFYGIPIKTRGYRGWTRGLTKETDERVRNMSEAKKGRIIPEAQILKMVASRKGYRHTEATKAKIGRANFRGLTPLHLLIRTSTHYRLWRSDVFTRDDFTCQKCGKRASGKLNAHHKESFAYLMELNDIKTIKQAINCEELWNINNGITYCEQCHKEEHRINK